MLLSGLLEQSVRVPSTTTAVSVQIQSVEDMANQTFQYDDKAMRNGNGDPPQALVLVVPRAEEPEEQTIALQAADLSFPEDTVAQSCARIFVHAPQYHWHTSGIGGIDQEARERLVPLEALVDRFGQQIEDHEEVLANCVDAEGAARARGLAKFQEFRETWIGELEGIQETLAGLTDIVNMQGIALKDLEIDVDTMREELKISGQVDDADRKAAKQSVTHLQHKIESALQDRLAAHQLLQKQI